VKKSLIIMMLAAICFTSGCINEDTKLPQTPPVAEEEHTEDNKTEDPVKDSETKESIDDYMVSVKEQSDAIKYFLENEALTQTDMNESSGELYELWDEALNHIWGELKKSLPEEEFEKLLDEQRIWIEEKEKRVEEAGKGVEGGSIYALVVNSEAAIITEERVYELYELFK